jgi:mannosyltransferase
MRTLNPTRRYLLAILLLAALLRLYGLGDESLWLDEGATARRTTESYPRLVAEFQHQAQTPLYFVIEKAWCNTFGTSEFWLRLPSALLGIAATLAVFLLAREIFSTTVGLFAALLLAINPFAIYYSQEARPYALFLLASVLSLYFLLRLMRNLRWQEILAYLVCTVLALYAHPLGPLLLAVHGAALLIFHRVEGYRAGGTRPRAVLVAIAVAAVMYVPQLVFMWPVITAKVEGSSPAAWIPIPSFITAVHAVRDYFMSPALAKVAMVIMAVGLALRLATRSKAWSGLYLLVALILGFLVAPWVISRVLTPVFVVRYTIPALAAFLILLAWALFALAVPLRVIALAVFFALTAYTLHGYYTGLDKAPWREVAKLVREEVRPGDMVVLNAFYISEVFNYYFRVPNGVTVAAPQFIEDIPASLDSAPRIWLVQAYDSTPREATRVLLARIATNRTASEPVHFHDWTKPNPHAFWLSDIRVTRYEITEKSNE